MDSVVKRVFTRLFSQDLNYLNLTGVNEFSYSKKFLYFIDTGGGVELERIKINIHLYYKIEQTHPNVSPNVSLCGTLIKRKNFVGEQFNCFNNEDLIFFNESIKRIKRCIWGSLVTFVIKMNFID